MRGCTARSPTAATTSSGASATRAVTSCGSTCGSSPFTAADEELLLVVVRDIQADKQREEDRRDKELRHRESQKLESLGLFAGGLAHDFNNLLVGVLGNADIARRDLALGHDITPQLAHISQSARTAAELTTRLLAYSGRGRFRVATTDLNAVVRSCLATFEPPPTHNATLRLRLREDLPPIEADAAQLAKALEELLSNAREALRGVAGELLVRTDCRFLSRPELDRSIAGADLPEGDHVCVEVADTGRGMDDQVLRRAFDPFFSTRLTARGLGLAAVLGIVRAHRGAIRVDSAPGEGASFLMLFPKQQQPTRPATTAPPADLDAWQPEGEVLVVDDTESVLAVARVILERKGFQVTTAADGVDALAILEKEPQRFLLVLLDMTMPRLGGEATLTEIRRFRPDLPVILCSGYDPQETASRFQNEAHVGFLQKPFQTEDMLQAIYALLHR